MMAAGWIAASYVIGSIPTGYWYGRLRGIDIRRHGSGNVGATNVARVLGKGPGLLTLAIDIAKGAMVVILAKRFFPDHLGVDVASGVAAILGHTFSLFVRFRGGKGVATTAGVFGALLPIPMAFAAGVFALTLVVFKIVSLGSILAALTLSIASFVHTPDVRLSWTATAISALVIWKHRSNIQRLLNGREPRIDEKPMGTS